MKPILCMSLFLIMVACQEPCDIYTGQLSDDYFDLKIINTQGKDVFDDPIVIDSLQVFQDSSVTGSFKVIEGTTDTFHCVRIYPLIQFNAKIGKPLFKNGAKVPLMLQYKSGIIDTLSLDLIARGDHCGGQHIAYIRMLFQGDTICAENFKKKSVYTITTTRL